MDNTEKSPVQTVIANIESLPLFSNFGGEINSQDSVDYIAEMRRDFQRKFRDACNALGIESSVEQVGRLSQCFVESLSGLKEGKLDAATMDDCFDRAIECFCDS